MQQHQYAKIGRIIENLHPDMVKGLVAQMKPELTDTSVISAMYAHYSTNHDPENNFNDKLIFIASILKLYCPSALFFDCRLTNGVNITLTKVMGYNHMQSVSYYISPTRVYIKNSNFKEAVERISAELKEVI
jgi:hypothetical protein